jgi:hypothetical protein
VTIAFPEHALFLYFCDESIVVEVVATDWIENSEKY